jgi:hypothetical protein
MSYFRSEISAPSGTCRAAFKASLVCGYALISASMLGRPGHAAVFGADQRQPLQSHAGALANAVGKLSSSAPPVTCTAVCIADDIIATAGHCLAGTENAPVSDFEAYRFETASGTGPPLSARIAGHQTANTRQNVILGLDRLRQTAPINADEDWAIARLDTPVCRHRGLALAETLTAADPHDTALVAMHADLDGQTLYHQGGCHDAGLTARLPQHAVVRDFANPSAVLFHTCDTGPGASGGPILSSPGGKTTVLGINTGTYALARAMPSAATSTAHDTAIPVANTAVPAVHLLMPLAELSARQLLSEPDDINRLAVMLASMGYDADPQVFTVTDRLIAGIKAFEAAQQLPVTGLVSPSILARAEAAMNAGTVETGSLP